MLHVCGYIYHHSPTFFLGKCWEAFSIPGVLRHDIWAPPNRSVASGDEGLPWHCPEESGKYGFLGLGIGVTSSVRDVFRKGICRNGRIFYWDVFNITTFVLPYHFVTVSIATDGRIYVVYDLNIINMQYSQYIFWISTCCFDSPIRGVKQKPLLFHVYFYPMLIAI